MRLELRLEIESRAPRLSRTAKEYEEPTVKTDADHTPKGRTMELRLALFIIVGAALGYGYHRLVGCRTGACMITANPYVSTLYGALMGYLLSAGFTR